MCIDWRDRRALDQHVVDPGLISCTFSDPLSMPGVILGVKPEQSLVWPQVNK